MKSHRAKKNTFTMAELIVLVQEDQSRSTPQTWIEAVTHAEQLQDKLVQQDIKTEHFVKSFVIKITDSSDGEEDYD